MKNRSKLITALIKNLMLLLALALCMPAAVNAQEEKELLVYSYGSKAMNMHMEGEINSIDYCGKEWLLEDSCFEFAGAFTMLGGKTRAIYECEVPKGKVNALPNGESMHLGTVIISPFDEMILYIFEGDRVSGEYTLVNCVIADEYSEELYTEKDLDGGLTLTDKVYLFTYNQMGEQVYYAASVYISFEDHDAAKATDIEQWPGAVVLQRTEKERSALEEKLKMSEAKCSELANEVLAFEETVELYQNQLAEKDAVISEICAAMEEFQNNEIVLTEQIVALTLDNAELPVLKAAVIENEATITVKTAEIELLQNTEHALNEQISALTQENAQLSILKADAAEKEAQIVGLNETVHQLQTEAAEKDLQVQNLQSRVSELEGELAALKESLQNAEAINQQHAKKEEEAGMLIAPDFSFDGLSCLLGREEAMDVAGKQNRVLTEDGLDGFNGVKFIGEAFDQADTQQTLVFENDALIQAGYLFASEQSYDDIEFMLTVSYGNALHNRVSGGYLETQNLSDVYYYSVPEACSADSDSLIKEITEYSHRVAKVSEDLYAVIEHRIVRVSKDMWGIKVGTDYHYLVYSFIPADCLIK